jgi:hypothetical protein
MPKILPKSIKDNKEVVIDEDLWNLYKIIIDDIRFSKQQQWKIFYYGLVLHGSIIGFSQIIKLTCIKACLLTIFSLLGCILCIYYINHYNYDMRTYRKRLSKVQNDFSKYTKGIFGELPKNYTELSYNLPILIPVYMILFIGFIFVVWYLFIEKL